MKERGDVIFKKWMQFLVVCIAVTIGGLTVTAEEGMSEAEELLRKAYDASIDQDMETYATFVENLIYADEHTALREYKLLAQEHPLVRYDIIRTISSEAEEELFLVEEEYASDFTVRAAVRVKKIGGDWKVYITNETTSEEAAFAEVVKPARMEQPPIANPVPMNEEIWDSHSGKVLALLVVVLIINSYVGR